MPGISAMRLTLALLFTLLLSLPLAGPAAAAEWVNPPAESGDPFAALAHRPPLPEDFMGVEGLYASVHGHRRDLVTVDRLAAHAATSVPAIAERLGVGTGPRMRVVLADDQEAFRALQPGPTPSWADGTAWPHQALIFLRTPRVRPGTAAPLEQVLDHEITHVLLGQAFGNRPVPTWLQEGLAQFIAGEYSPDTVHKLSQATFSGGLLSLDDLKHGFPHDPVRASLAYAQSADLIAYIATEYGESAVHTLVGEMARGAPVNAALRTATGEFADDLDAEWRAGLEQSGFALSVLSNETLWFGLGAPVLFFGWLGVRRRNRRRKEEMAEEEARQDAFYAAMRRGRQQAPPPPPRRPPLDGYRVDGEGHPWVH